MQNLDPPGKHRSQKNRGGTRSPRENDATHQKELEKPSYPIRFQAKTQAIPRKTRHTTQTAQTEGGGGAYTVSI